MYNCDDCDRKLDRPGEPDSKHEFYTCQIKNDECFRSKHDKPAYHNVCRGCYRAHRRLVNVVLPKIARLKSQRAFQPKGTRTKA